MLRTSMTWLTITLLISVSGCKKSGESTSNTKGSGATHSHGDGADHSHGHGDHGHSHGHDHTNKAPGAAPDHAHEEVSIGSAKIGEIEVQLAQGHGKVAAGKECHLVVKLPYNDKGSTVVRAWLGVQDRTKSMVAKATYAPSHDDYDLHAMAPDPLPEDTQWWVEIEKPDGTKQIGSAKPLM